MKSLSITLSVVILSLCMAPISRADTVVYQTGFESPTYSPGGFAGQDGWFGTSIASVQTATVQTGAQAVEFDASLDTNNTQQLIERVMTLTSAPIVTVQTSFYLTSAGAASAWNPIAVFGDGNQLIGQIFIGANGQLKGTDVVHDQWNTVKWVFDFNTQTSDTYLNDVYLGSNNFANAVTGIQRLAAGLSQNPGTDQLYIDNLSVTATTVPEPATATLLAAAAFPLILRRRRA